MATLLAPHISVQSDDEQQDYTIALNVTYQPQSPSDSESLKELRDTYQRSTV